MNGDEEQESHACCCFCRTIFHSLSLFFSPRQNSCSSRVLVVCQKPTQHPTTSDNETRNENTTKCFFVRNFFWHSKSRHGKVLNTKFSLSAHFPTLSFHWLSIGFSVFSLVPCGRRVVSPPVCLGTHQTEFEVEIFLFLLKILSIPDRSPAVATAGVMCVTLGSVCWCWDKRQLVELTFWN